LLNNKQYINNYIKYLLKNRSYSSSINYQNLKFIHRILSRKHPSKNIYKRYLTISSLVTGYKYNIHKGNRFNKLMVQTWIIGHKFGEFSFTRKPFIFIKKKKEKRR